MLIRVRGALAAIAAALLVAATASASQGAAPQTDPATLNSHAQEGERALAEGRYADAEKAYETLRRLSPATPEVHARLGLIYFQQGKFREAITPLRQALKLKPGLSNIETLLAMSLSELGQYKEALPALMQGFKQTADPVLRRVAGLHLQRAYTGLGRDRDAVEVALVLSRLHPDDPEVLYHTGRILANFAYLQTMRLAEVAPDSVWMHQAAGEANESQGLYDAAIGEYRSVLARAPRRPGIHFRIGRAFLSRSRGSSGVEGDVSNALAEFEAELGIDPTNANAAYEIAEIHRKAAEFGKAREYFERALTHYPDFEDALVGLGRTLIALDMPKEAVPKLEAAIKLNPESEVAHYQVAQAYRLVGRESEQRKALAEFTRLRAADAKRRPAVPEPTRDVTRQALDDPRPDDRLP